MYAQGSANVFAVAIHGNKGIRMASKVLKGEYKVELKGEFLVKGLFGLKRKVEEIEVVAKDQLWVNTSWMVECDPNDTLYLTSYGRLLERLFNFNTGDHARMWAGHIVDFLSGYEGAKFEGFYADDVVEVVDEEDEVGEDEELFLDLGIESRGFEKELDFLRGSNARLDDLVLLKDPVVPHDFFVAERLIAPKEVSLYGKKVRGYVGGRRKYFGDIEISGSCHEGSIYACTGDKCISKVVSPALPYEGGFRLSSTTPSICYTLDDEERERASVQLDVEGEITRCSTQVFGSHRNRYPALRETSLVCQVSDINYASFDVSFSGEVKNPDLFKKRNLEI